MRVFQFLGVGLKPILREVALHLQKKELNKRAEMCTSTNNELILIIFIYNYNQSHGDPPLVYSACLHGDRSTLQGKYGKRSSINNRRERVSVQKR